MMEAVVVPELLEAAMQRKAEEEKLLRLRLKVNAVQAVGSLPRAEDGVPFVMLRLDDADAWKVLAFYSQKLRERGDLEGRVQYMNIAHAAEMGYWNKGV